MNEKITYVSDIVPKEEIKTWSKGNYIITGKTGTGKSVWALEVLGCHAKETNQKILILENRKATVSQLRIKVRELGYEDTIRVDTYQSIESKILTQRDYGFEQYDYMVLDEWHYFLSDANFNNYTDLSLKSLLKNTNNTTNIFMSATSENILTFNERVLKLEIKKEYMIDNSFNNINSIIEYNHKEDFDSLVHEIINLCIENNEKAIIFINNTLKLQRFIDKFTDYKNLKIAFTVAKSNQLYNKKSQETMDYIIENEHFNETILFTTEVFSTGINIIDDKVKHIIIDTVDTESIIQSIGRKRLSYDQRGNVNQEDRVDVYVSKHSKGSIAQGIRRLEESIYLCNYLTTNGAKEFTKRIVKDCFTEGDKKIWMNKDLIYNQDGTSKSTPKINQAKLFSSKIVLEELYYKYKGNFNQADFIKEKLKVDCLTNVYEAKSEYSILIESLVKFKGKRLYGSTKLREEFIETLDLRRPDNNRLIKNYTVLSSYIEEITEGELILMDNSDKDMVLNNEKNPNYRKKYWELNVSP